MAQDKGRIPDLTELANRLAIFEVLAQHSRGVDRADEAILQSAYWPDAEVNYGGFNGNAHEFCKMLPTAIRGYARTHHAISNINIAFNGDDARAPRTTRITGGLTRCPVAEHLTRRMRSWAARWSPS